MSGHDRNRNPPHFHLKLSVHRRYGERFSSLWKPVVGNHCPKGHVFEASIATVHQGQEKYWEECGAERCSKECSLKPKTTPIRAGHP